MTKAGRSFTTIRRIASIPRSAKSIVSLETMCSLAMSAAAPPIHTNRLLTVSLPATNAAQSFRLSNP